MSQVLKNTPVPNELKSLNLVSWRIRRARAEDHAAQVNKLLLSRLHDDNRVLN